MSSPGERMRARRRVWDDGVRSQDRREPPTVDRPIAADDETTQESWDVRRDVERALRRLEVERIGEAQAPRRRR